MKPGKRAKTITLCITGDADELAKEPVESCLEPLCRTLQKYNVSMTIPVTAKGLTDYPERAMYIASQGHELAVHGDVHMPFCGNCDLQYERMENAKKIFKNVMGIIPTGFRAPYLKHDYNTFLALVRAGFTYDSSRARNEFITKIPVLNKYTYDMGLYPLIRPGLGICASLIYRSIPSQAFLLGDSLVEVPLTGPSDSLLGRIYKEPHKKSFCEQIAGLWLDILEIMRNRTDQVYVIQWHPSIVSPGFLDAIEIFLSSVCNDDSIIVKQMGEVARQFRPANENLVKILQ